ncbi:hypothetical protein GCM10008107_06730 [Psychrosphaera saromensis]|nr:hypothetical protein GCM10008107_06730 [Psychrosphaera saromensis]GLQ14629.1 hypothetical protein GCM10007917_20840 [Psychrosphaera saromensis]
MDVVIEYGVLLLGVISIPIAMIYLFKYLSSKDSKYFKIFFVLSIFVITVLIHLSYSEFWRVDSCLDSGGSFNYSQSTCEY